MEDDNGESVAGTLAAHGFILENLYALLLGSDPKPIAACRNTAQAMLRDFASLRPAADETDTREVHRILGHGYAELERFWISVEARIRPPGRG